MGYMSDLIRLRLQLDAAWGAAGNSICAGSATCSGYSERDAAVYGWSDDDSARMSWRIACRTAAAGRGSRVDCSDAWGAYSDSIDRWGRAHRWGRCSWAGQQIQTLAVPPVAAPPVRVPVRVAALVSCHHAAAAWGACGERVWNESSCRIQALCSRRASRPYAVADGRQGSWQSGIPCHRCRTRVAAPWCVWQRACAACSAVGIPCRTPRTDVGAHRCASSGECAACKRRWSSACKCRRCCAPLALWARHVYDGQVASLLWQEVEETAKESARRN